MSSRHNWTNEQEMYLLEQLCSQAKAGNRAGQSFKDNVWKLVQDRVNTKFKVNLTCPQLKSKNATLRNRLQMTLNMKSRSGWGLGVLKKRVHQNPTQIDALTNTPGQALEMMKPPAIDQSPATSLKLPESVQLTTFGKVLADPHNAAMFLGTDLDEALVEFLKDLQDEF
ncbi:hypothetical protein BDR26DRAFT_940859 [Obelidium mucronatum]|nr:hypothetical protein BDR26DRAFT_940859 [Obelidium mucronatum]